MKENGRLVSRDPSWKILTRTSNSRAFLVGDRVI